MLKSMNVLINCFLDIFLVILFYTAAYEILSHHILANGSLCFKKSFFYFLGRLVLFLITVMLFLLR